MNPSSRFGGSVVGLVSVVSRGLGASVAIRLVYEIVGVNFRSAALSSIRRGVTNM